MQYKKNPNYRVLFDVMILIYIALCTLPALKQDVQTLILLTVPFSMTFTDCKFGLCLYTLCLCENESFEAFNGFLPHIAHSTDILFSFQELHI